MAKFSTFEQQKEVLKYIKRLEDNNELCTDIELLNFHKDSGFKLSLPSILQKLEKEGYIRIKSSPDFNDPYTKIYSITGEDFSKRNNWFFRNNYQNLKWSIGIFITLLSIIITAILTCKGLHKIK